MQLVAYGMQDVYLTGNSQVTFFKNLYRRHTNFSVEAVQQTFQSSSRAFGNRLVSVVSRNGDLLHRVWLEVSLRAQTADVTYVNNLCHALVKSAEVEIGGQRIDRVYGRFSHLWHKLTCRAGKEFGFDVMAGCGGVPGDADSPQAAPSFATSRKVFIPIDFFFSKGRAGSALPLIALQYHEVRITIELADKDEILRSVQVRDYEGTEEQISYHRDRNDPVRINSLVDAAKNEPNDYVKTQISIGTSDTWNPTLEGVGQKNPDDETNYNQMLRHSQDLYEKVLIDRNKIVYSNETYSTNLEQPDASKITAALVKINGDYNNYGLIEEAVNDYVLAQTNAELETNANTQFNSIKNSDLFGVIDNNFGNIELSLRYLNKAKYDLRIFEKIMNHLNDANSVTLSFTENDLRTLNTNLSKANGYIYGDFDSHTGIYQSYYTNDNNEQKDSLTTIYEKLETAYPSSLFDVTISDEIRKRQIEKAVSDGEGIKTKLSNLKSLAEHTKNKALGQQGTLGDVNFATFLADLPLADIGFNEETDSYSSAKDFALLTHAANLVRVSLKVDIFKYISFATGLKEQIQDAATKSDMESKINDDLGTDQFFQELSDDFSDYYDAVKHLLVTYFVGGYSSAAGRGSFDDIVDFEEQPRLFTDFFFLDTEERRRFSQMSHEYLIEQLQFLGTEVTPKLSQGSEVPFSMELDFNHPTKALYWTTEVSDGNKARRNPFYNGLSETEPNTLECRSHQGIYDNCPVASVSLNLNGYDRFSPRDGEYFWLCQPYQHHRRVPHDHWLGMYSFCLKPEEHQPSGTLNFSRIDAARLTMHFKSHASECRRDVYVYALNYNVLRILSGMGGLAFSN